ncbi:MAG: hypothetical protein MUF62_10165, partial [Chitinophagaceae bacterium]|nr:hypothetical protein [Chitinophagaceae bacterium]
MLRKKIYKWHRTISLLIAVPVMLWALSGFLHPIMTTWRPQVGSQFIPPAPIDTSQLKMPLKAVLTAQGIEAVETFRIVRIDRQWFYQVQLPGQPVLQYYSTVSGKPLRNGDALYAQYLAKKFLKGPEKAKQPAAKTASEGVAALAPQTGLMMLRTADSKLPQEEANADEVDCCLSATNAILADTSGAKVTSVAFVTGFEGEYREINRLLPVYKVAFDRADGIRIYVETSTDRFAYAVDNRRAAADKFFNLFHNLGWLNFLGTAKYWVTISIMLLAFGTSVMGLYILFTTKGKRGSSHPVVRTRYAHRWTSGFFALFTLLFTFSGAFHAFEKLEPDTRDRFFMRQTVATRDIDMNWAALYAAIDTGRQLTNVKPVKMGNQLLWQLYSSPRQMGGRAAEASKKKDLMKSMEVPPPTTVYFNADLKQLLPNGEEVFARHIASTFSGHAASAITNT